MGYGDFEEVVDGKIENNQVEQPGFVRARLPRKPEIIGIILQRLGGNRMEVKSTDGKTRNCRVPGKYKRKLWLRPGDYILVLPWKDDDEKGDIIYKYSSAEINQLNKQGLIKGLKEGF